jgi:hypothetical protein
VQEPWLDGFDPKHLHFCNICARLQEMAHRLFLRKKLEIAIKILQTKAELFRRENSGLKKAIKLTKRKRQCKKPVKDYPFDRSKVILMQHEYFSPSYM